MNSKERVLTAFKHKEADRVPVGEMHIMSPFSSEVLGREAITGEGGWTHREMMRLVSSGRRDEYVERLSKDTLDVWRALELDLICTELDPPKESSVTFEDITDESWTEIDKATGHWSRFAYSVDTDTVHEVDCTEKDDPDFEAVEAHLDALEKAGCDIDDSCFESTKYIVENAPDLFVMGKVPNLIPSGRGWYSNFMEMIYLEPELTQRLCDVYLKVGLTAVRKYIEAGVDCVMIATDWAMNTGPIFAVDKIVEYLIPQVRAISDYCHAHGVKVLKHTDGNIMKFADEFFDMGIDAYQGIESNVGMDIGYIKQKYGDRITLMGNVCCAKTLPFGTKEQIIEETKSCIGRAGHGGGFILSSSNTLAYPIKAEAYKTMRDTAREYGQYPLQV